MSKEKRYVKLKKLGARGALKYYQEFNIPTHFRLEDYYDYVDDVEKLPKGAKRGIVKPILVIVHDRVFPESANGWLKGQYAYLTQEAYRNLF